MSGIRSIKSDIGHPQRRSNSEPAAFFVGRGHPSVRVRGPVQFRRRIIVAFPVLTAKNNVTPKESYLLKQNSEMTFAPFELRKRMKKSLDLGSEIQSARSCGQTLSN